MHSPGWRGSGSGHRQRFADVDQIVGQHAQSDPALHSLATAIQTAPQSVPPLHHADTSFAACAPTLRLLEPATPFHLFALRTTCVAVRYRDPFHTLLLYGPLLRLRIVTGIRCYQSQQASYLAFVRLHGAQQQIAIARPLVEHFIMCDDLILGFLHLHQLAELGGLAGLTLADNLAVRLEQTDDLVR